MKPDWSREGVLAEIGTYSAEIVAPTGSQVERYCRYYEIDFAKKMPQTSHRIGWTDVLGYKVVVQSFLKENSRGTVVVLHGYFDHVGLYRHLIRYLLEHNYSVVCYDQPGHGLSSGPLAAIKSFEEYQAVLQRVLSLAEPLMPRPWYAVGQSTGGAVLIDHLLFAPRKGKVTPFSHVALLAPLIRPMGWQAGKLLHAMMQPFVKTWKRAFSENSSDQMFVKFIREHDPLQSRIMGVDWISSLKRWVPRVEAADAVANEVTIIQGKLDLTVDWRHNVKVIQEKFPNSSLLKLPFGRHHMVNESEDIRFEAFSAIGQAFEMAASQPE
ncbi:MAG: alpha/beta hydrolase [Hahellaceae bacterium]|nr:alpha/beta hydrolase [Hahellaceae bacterium]MCP5168734.1 alpha/beta hydrolase [Hahellaceae bacterium]